MAEVGLPDVRAYAWQGLFAPRGTPRPVVGRLNRALHAAIGDPAVRAGAAEIGVPMSASTSEEFRAEVEADLRKWSEVIRVAGIERQ